MANAINTFTSYRVTMHTWSVSKTLGSPSKHPTSLYLTHFSVFNPAVTKLVLLWNTAMFTI